MQQQQQQNNKDMLLIKWSLRNLHNPLLPSSVSSLSQCWKRLLHFFLCNMHTLSPTNSEQPEVTLYWPLTHSLCLSLSVCLTCVQSSLSLGKATRRQDGFIQAPEPWRCSVFQCRAVGVGASYSPTRSYSEFCKWSLVSLRLPSQVTAAETSSFFPLSASVLGSSRAQKCLSHYFIDRQY